MRVLHKKKSYEGLLICWSFDSLFLVIFYFLSPKVVSKSV